MTTREDMGLDVSCLMDGECEPGEVDRIIDYLHDNPELRRRWQRYHITSDVLRRQLSYHVDLDFAERLRTALDQEPTILAPRALPDRSRPLVQRVAGFAVAASVAALAIFSVQFLITHDNPSVPQVASAPAPEGVTPAPQGAPTQVAASGQPTVSPSQAPEAAVAANATLPVANIEESQWISDPQIKKFLVNHSEHSVGAGVNGMLPYARIVGYRIPEQEQQ